MIRDSLPKGLMLALICLNVVNGQSRLTRPITQDNNSRVEGPSLQLTTKILSQEYCVGDSELDSLRLKVRLTYTNKGKQTIILYRGPHLISRTMISRNFGEAGAKHFEVNSVSTHITSGGDQCYKGASPNKCFVVIPPGASYETEDTAGTFVVRGDAREITGAVKSGNHVLQLKVITWEESNMKADKLRARWRRYGTVWFEPVTSDPMPFTVEKQRKVADCP